MCDLHENALLHDFLLISDVAMQVWRFEFQAYLSQSEAIWDWYAADIPYSHFYIIWKI